MDTEQPILKLDNLTFLGRWERLMGTNLYFEEDEERKVRVLGSGKYKIVFSQVIPVSLKQLPEEPVHTNEARQEGAEQKIDENERSVGENKKQEKEQDGGFVH